MNAFERIARAVVDPLVLVSATGEILAANAPAATLCQAFATGSRLEEALADGREVTERLRAWSRHGSPVPERLSVRGRDGTVEVRVEVARVDLAEGPAILVHVRRNQHAPFAQLNDRLRHLQREVGYRVAAERERAAALEAEQVTRARLERIQQLSAALAAALDVDDVIRAVLALAAAAADADRVVVAVSQGDDLELSAHEESIAAGVAEARIPLDGSHPLALAVRDRQPRFFDDGEGREADVAGSVTGAGEYLAGALPLLPSPQGPLLGVLGIVCRRGRVLSADERASALLVVLLCAQALERARLYDNERRFTETLQLALLPRALPDLDGIDLAVTYLPASEHVAVGGDWYDAIPLSRDRVALIVGDAVGHGPAAATAMGQMRNVLRAFAFSVDEPGQALAAFNDYLCTQLPDEMATVVYVMVDQGRRTLSYANAGHPPALLFDADGRHGYLRRGLGPPVGVTPHHRYATVTLPLRAPMRVVCYSDGLIERRSESIDQGLRRLVRAATASGPDAESARAQIVKRLVGDDDLDDDAVALVADIG